MNHLRLQSPRKLSVRGRVIGGPVPLICLPLMAKDTQNLLAQAEETAAMRPDLVEWRADRMEFIPAPGTLKHMLASLRDILADIPLIFTCRSFDEGGSRRIDKSVRRRLNSEAAASECVDLIDTELSNGTQWIAALRQACQPAQVALILSYHNFDATPEEVFLLDRMLAAQTLGADVAKVAVTARNFADVLTLLSATFRGRAGRVNIPLITVSMEAHGTLTRIVGGMFGSDITFAAGSSHSAPGQIPIAALRKAWAALGVGSESPDLDC